MRTSIGELGHPRPWPWRAEAIRPEVCLSSSVPGDHLPLSPHMGSGRQQELTGDCFSSLLLSSVTFSTGPGWPMLPFSPAFQELLAFPKSTLIKDWTESHCLVASRTAQLLAPMACSSGIACCPHPPPTRFQKLASDVYKHSQAPPLASPWFSWTSSQAQPLSQPMAPADRFR